MEETTKNTIRYDPCYYGLRSQFKLTLKSRDFERILGISLNPELNKTAEVESREIQRT